MEGGGTTVDAAVHQWGGTTVPDPVAPYPLLPRQTRGNSRIEREGGSSTVPYTGSHPTRPRRTREYSNTKSIQQYRPRAYTGIEEGGHNSLPPPLPVKAKSRPRTVVSTSGKMHMYPLLRTSGRVQQCRGSPSLHRPTREYRSTTREYRPRTVASTSEKIANVSCT